jgi:glycosyltransferase involved in cell wall biosynthesis
LLVAPNVFHRHTGGGVTLTNLFRGWPADRIAMIYSEPLEPDTRVCQKFFRLGISEVRKWAFLDNLRSLWKKQNNQTTSSVVSNKTDAGFTKKLYEIVVGDGLPEEARVSEELDRFITDFQPELVYTFLGYLSFIQLVDAIVERYNIPYVVHMMDDWPSTIYQRGLFSRWLRPQLDPHLRSNLRRAKVRMGISDSMCKAYQARYGFSFVPFHNALDLTQWQKHHRTTYNAGRPFRVVYAGSILPNAQLDSIRDVAAAVRRLHEKDIPIEMILYANVSAEQRSSYGLDSLPVIRYESPLEDDTVAQKLAQADVLILPVNFDEASVNYIRYSMPTKIPAYLASGTPVLVYGPKGVAQVDYALNDHWGYVVQEQGISEIEKALDALISDEQLRANLGQYGIVLAKRNHDAAIVRPAFQSVLCEAAL